MWVRCAGPVRIGLFVVRADLLGTPRINHAPLLTRRTAATNQLASDPFVLIDVGASGGIEGHWRNFDPHLVAYGIEPLVRECERLNRAEPSERIRYFPCFVNDGVPVTGNPSSTRSPLWSTEAYSRTSALAAQDILKMSFTQRFNHQDPDIVMSDQHVSLDAFVRTHGIQSVDFVKVDTDGYDLQVLRGAAAMLSETTVLGLFVECQLQGPTSDDANVFANIDRELRRRGFSLFDLEVYRYSRAALPGHFAYEIPAQTLEGQVIWGDALYLRDVTLSGYFEQWGSLSAQKLLKLACLHEIFGMPDCAAELLRANASALSPLLDIDDVLDLLAREIEPSARSYAQHMRKFQSDPTSFYPRKRWI